MRDLPYSLNNITLVTPEKVQRRGGLTVSKGCIADLASLSRGRVIDLSDHLLFPGLINAHDHLLGTWWPPVAPNRPYTNVYQWLDDYEQSPVLKARGNNSSRDIYALGAYRNLISGVTTVADHYKRIDGPGFYRRFPVCVLHQYGRSWLPRTARKTGWGQDIQEEYQLAVSNQVPYIIHLAEGIDAETAQEMDILSRAGAIGRNTMVIHGIGLRSQDMQRLAEANATVCWCPASNLYLYERTANIPALLEAGVTVTLGTDSTMTGSLNLLQEVRTARTAYRNQAGRDPSARWLVQLMTTCAAHALMLNQKRGQLQPGYLADLLVVPESGPDPYTTLIETTPKDIALVMRKGLPVYADPSFADLFEWFSLDYSEVSVSGRPKLIVGDPLALVKRISDRVGEPLDFPFLPCTPLSEDTQP